MEIIVKKYEHFNKALPNWTSPKGVYVKSKSDYDRKLKESGMISYEEMKQRTAANKAKQDAPYHPPAKVLEIIREARKTADKNGNVKLSGRTIEAMKEMGAIRKKLPEHIKLPDTPQGGFSA